MRFKIGDTAEILASAKDVGVYNTEIGKYCKIIEIRNNVTTDTIRDSGKGYIINTDITAWLVRESDIGPIRKKRVISEISITELFSPKE